MLESCRRKAPFRQQKHINAWLCMEFQIAPLFLKAGKDKEGARQGNITLQYPPTTSYCQKQDYEPDEPLVWTYFYVPTQSYMIFEHTTTAKQSRHPLPLAFLVSLLLESSERNIRMGEQPLQSQIQQQNLFSLQRQKVKGWLGWRLSVFTGRV